MNTFSLGIFLGSCTKTIPHNAYLNFGIVFVELTTRIPTVNVFKTTPKIISKRLILHLILYVLLIMFSGVVLVKQTLNV